VEAAVDLFSVQFLSALMAIVIIDLVLAGDNAIVIALAARNVPVRLRTKAIVWGTVGAIVVRSLLTMVVVWLLAVPGLLFAGGALLVWIAYKLLLPEPEDENGVRLNQVNSFWAAIRTIVVADIVMGLDNVLAVAGAAHGSFLLVALGLLISIPIVVWGSTVILRFIDRYPACWRPGSSGTIAASSPALPRDWRVSGSSRSHLQLFHKSKKETSPCKESWSRWTARPIRSMPRGMWSMNS
jgi:YjbE family integral membrane protein